MKFTLPLANETWGQSYTACPTRVRRRWKVFRLRDSQCSSASASVLRIWPRQNSWETPTTVNLCGNQPLRWARTKYSRAALRRPRRDRFGSFLDETHALGPSSTRVEEASSKQHQFAPKRSGLETLISAQVHAHELGDLRARRRRGGADGRAGDHVAQHRRAVGAVPAVRVDARGAAAVPGP